MKYRARIADGELTARLRATGAVLIEGPRGCGKTETARRAARSEVLLDIDDEARVAALLDPGLVLPGQRPRLIDEWQLVPGIWNRVRRAVDAEPSRSGQFILTGSSVPADDATRHTGALRFSRLRMRPMSLAESGHSTASVSVRALLAGADATAPDPGLRVSDIAERVAVGGWPGLLDRTVADALEALRGLLDEVRSIDLPRVDGVRRDPEGVARVLRSLARKVATSASISAIARDVTMAGEPVDRHTVADYLAALARVMVIEDLPGWAPALRSRSFLRTTPTRHFVDPSLAVAALGADPARLLADVRTLGYLFEGLVVRDLRIHGQASDATVHHYRDSDGLEVDAIVQRRDGTWAAFEVKLGPNAADQGAASLLRLADRIDRDRHPAPAALVVVTGWGYAYRRPDGVQVVPIGTLGP